MRDKLVMIFGVGSSKAIQILFSFFLAYKFSHEALSIFVLILTLASATSTITSLGGAPQILRASAYESPINHIQSTLGAALIVFLFSLALLFIYLAFSYISAGSNLHDNFTHLFSVVLITSALVLFSITQAFLSYDQSYFKLGLYSILIYILPFITSIIMSYLFGDYMLVIFLYSIVFFVCNLIAIITSTKDKLNYYEILEKVKIETKLAYRLKEYLNVSLFGFITMISLYLTLNYVNSNYSSIKSSLYSVSFQFFQIGTFLPGVMGAIFVPKIIKTNNNIKNLKRMISVYITISISWFILCLLLTYPIFKLYNFPVVNELIKTFIFMQLCVILSALQAFYNQKFVANGKFGFLGLNACVWGAVLILMPYILPKSLYYMSLSLITAYLISLIIFSINNRYQTKISTF